MNFHMRMQQKQELRKQRYRRMKQYLTAFLLFCAGWTACGFYSHEPAETRETYTVRSGDTLRNICERYLAETGSRRYILDFEQDVRELNPWLDERHGQLCPGDQLLICYESPMKR